MLKINYFLATLFHGGSSFKNFSNDHNQLSDFTHLLTCVGVNRVYGILDARITGFELQGNLLVQSVIFSICNTELVLCHFEINKNKTNIKSNAHGSSE